MPSSARKKNYKSTDGILSHCKTVLDIAIVYLGVYHALPAILRNSLIDCGGLQCTETAILTVPFRYSLAADLAACNVRFPRLSGRNWRRGTNARSRPAERAENKRSLIELP